MSDTPARPVADAAPGSSPGAPPDAPDPGLIATLKRKATLGVIVLIARTAVLQVVVLGGNVYLSRILTPGDFGAFAIVQFAIAFFALFGDAGLGGALIQKKTEPTEEELSSVFWLQVLLSVFVMAVVFGGSAIFVRVWPDLPQNGAWLMRAMSVEFFLTALRVIPAILLERQLSYGRLSFLEFVLQVVFYVSAIVFARLHLGIMALVLAALLQGASGLLVVYALRPWRPRLVLSIELLRPILRFGLAYQARAILGFLNGAITPIFAGAMLGRTALGLNNWAQNTAYFPLKLVDIMGRVSFPLFSRLQNDKEAFATSLERSVQICAMAILFFVGLFFGLGPNVIHVIYTDQWMPALPLLLVYASITTLGFLAPLIAAALDAIGKPGILLRLSIFWTALNWVVVIAVMAKWRTPFAFAVGYGVHVVVGNLAVVYVMLKLMPDTHLWPRVRASLVAALATAALGHWVLSPWAMRPWSFVLAVLASLLAFAGVLILLDRSLIKDAMAIIPALRKKGEPPAAPSVEAAQA